MPTLENTFVAVLHAMGDEIQNPAVSGNPPVAPPHVGKWWTQKMCLMVKYLSRIDQLSTVGQKHGPFIFNRIDLFAAKPSVRGMSGSASGFCIQEASYPQIDNNDTPAADAWNKLAVRKLPVTWDCRTCDFENDYDIQYANENLISTAWHYSQYCHGAAHGMGWGKVENLILHPEIHELQASDVFGPDDGWTTTFQDLAWEALQKEGWSPPKDHEDEIKAQMLAKAIKPDRWAFTKDGIQIGFDPYEGGSYANTPRPITISWEELKPLMTPNSIVPKRGNGAKSISTRTTP